MRNAMYRAGFRMSREAIQKERDEKELKKEGKRLEKLAKEGK